MLPPLLALFSWPAVVLAFGRLQAGPLGFLLAILGGFLLLPENTAINLPMFPSLSKHSIPALSVLLFLSLFARGNRDTLPLFPRHWAIRLAVLALIIGAFMTVVTNGDPLLVGGGRYLRGLQLYDGLSAILSATIMILPMLLARKLLPRPEHHVLLLQVICIAALGYSLLALYEVRMSPQLNRMLYGFFPHSWLQHIRGGGFRPLVFLEHGLILSLFFCMAVLSAAGLSGVDRKRRGQCYVALAWLLITLVLSKSLGATLIALVLLPVMLVLRGRTLLIVATVIAGLVISYPVMRSSGMIPIDDLMTMAEDYSAARAQSLGVRLENEERMLSHANERPAFGWGGWGRALLYDPDTGESITIADGLWTITLGTGGWVRFLATFGLLAMPIWLTLFHWRRSGIGQESAVLALILAANMIDLIPNTGMTPVTWIIAGALWGRIELGRIAEGEAEPETGAKRGAPAYSRTVPVLVTRADIPKLQRSGPAPRRTRMAPAQEPEEAGDGISAEPEGSRYSRRGTEPKRRRDPVQKTCGQRGKETVDD